MLSYRELKTGTIFILDGQPYEVLEYNFMRLQQRKPVVQAKIKNLITGKIAEKSFHQSDTFEEAEIKKEEAIFIYFHRGEFWFYKAGSPKERFSLSENILAGNAQFLKAEAPVTVLKFRGKPIGVSLPVKIDYVVKQAPPAVKGNTAQGGSKTITLENGLEIQAPLFIGPGDIVRINTQTGQYVERMEKK